MAQQKESVGEFSWVQRFTKRKGLLKLFIVLNSGDRARLQNQGSTKDKIEDIGKGFLFKIVDSMAVRQTVAVFQLGRGA